MGGNSEWGTPPEDWRHSTKASSGKTVTTSITKPLSSSPLRRRRFGQRSMSGSSPSLSSRKSKKGVPNSKLPAIEALVRQASCASGLATDKRFLSRLGSTDSTGASSSSLLSWQDSSSMSLSMSTSVDSQQHQHHQQPQPQSQTDLPLTKLQKAATTPISTPPPPPPTTTTTRTTSVGTLYRPTAVYASASSSSVAVKRSTSGRLIDFTKSKGGQHLLRRTATTSNLNQYSRSTTMNSGSTNNLYSMSRVDGTDRSLRASRSSHNMVVNNRQQQQQPQPQQRYQQQQQQRYQQHRSSSSRRQHPQHQQQQQRQYYSMRSLTTASPRFRESPSSASAPFTPTLGGASFATLSPLSTTSSSASLASLSSRRRRQQQFQQQQQEQHATMIKTTRSSPYLVTPATPSTVGTLTPFRTPPSMGKKLNETSMNAMSTDHSHRNNNHHCRNKTKSGTGPTADRSGANDSTAAAAAAAAAANRRYNQASQKRGDVMVTPPAPTLPPRRQQQQQQYSTNSAIAGAQSMPDLQARVKPRMNSNTKPTSTKVPNEVHGGSNKTSSMSNNNTKKNSNPNEKTTSNNNNKDGDEKDELVQFLFKVPLNRRKRSVISAQKRMETIVAASERMMMSTPSSMTGGAPGSSPVPMMRSHGSSSELRLPCRSPNTKRGSPMRRRSSILARMAENAER